jgi:hypothetical protein
MGRKGLDSGFHGNTRFMLHLKIRRQLQSAWEKSTNKNFPQWPLEAVQLICSHFSTQIAKIRPRRCKSCYDCKYEYSPLLHRVSKQATQDRCTGWVCRQHTTATPGEYAGNTPPPPKYECTRTYLQVRSMTKHYGTRTQNPPPKNPIQISCHCDVKGIPQHYACLYQCYTWPIVKNNLFDDHHRGISLYLDTVHSVLQARTARGQL